MVFVTFGPRHLTKAAVLHKYAPDTVFLELAGSAGKYPWETDMENLPFQLIRLFPSRRQEELSRISVFPKVLKTLNHIKPDVVMYHGLLAPGFQALALWSKFKNIPAILHFDSWSENKTRISWQQQLKGKIYKFFFNCAFVAGKYSKDYLISMGYPKDKIASGCNVVDNNHFRIKSLFYKNNYKYCEKEGLPEKYFLMVARYSPEKDHHTLLKAYKRYVSSGCDWKLVLIGEGPLREDIKNLIKTLELDDHVIQKGWISYEKIPMYYSFAKCLIIPSLSETWSLAANEGAACGLPLILSNKCGCVPELCIPGVNGFVFKAGDPDELAKYMQKISDGSVDLLAFGEKSKELVSAFTLESWALKVLELKGLCLGKARMFSNPMNMKVF